MLHFNILTDNRINPELEKEGRLHTEHGLSIYVDYNGTKILCDTGASVLFLTNAATLGIEPREADFCFISHGHSDHTGGLLELLHIAPQKCRVYLSGQIEESRYYSCRREKKRDIGTNAKIFELYSSRLERISGSCWIAPDIAAVRPVFHNYKKPAGNSFLTMERDGIEKPDDFTHEFALAIKTGKGVVIFSPCSHSGLFNVAESCLEFTGSANLRAFIGGLHFTDGCEDPKEIEAVASAFMERYPNAQLYTGHCTGDNAIATLSAIMPENIFKVFRTGESFSL